LKIFSEHLVFGENESKELLISMLSESKGSEYSWVSFGHFSDTPWMIVSTSSKPMHETMGVNSI
jgi:hypothetical protein